jgi:hypothetical protein
VVCYVDICKASTYVSKGDMSALRFIIPAIESELKERVFNPSQLFKGKHLILTEVLRVHLLLLGSLSVYVCLFFVFCYCIHTLPAPPFSQRSVFLSLSKLLLYSRALSLAHNHVLYVLFFSLVGADGTVDRRLMVNCLVALFRLSHRKVCISLSRTLELCYCCCCFFCLAGHCSTFLYGLRISWTSLSLSLCFSRSSFSSLFHSLPSFR